MNVWLGTALVCVGAVLSSCRTPDADTFSLYRNSVLDSLARYHVATFDASDGEKYNQENGELARVLFQQQPAVRTRFWCEKGRFRK